jgi:hypothetical protein
MAVIFVIDQTTGPLRLLPVIAVPMPHHFAPIVRERGRLPRFSYQSGRMNDALGNREETRRLPVSKALVIELLRIS